MKPDFTALRGEFPALSQTVHGRPLVYLDNAATTQKPRAVIDSIVEFYSRRNANIHRGVHFLSEQASDNYESVRERVRAFLNAESAEEIVFSSGATDSINCVAESYGRAFLVPGDDIVITPMEHHSNMLPWQDVCSRRNAVLRAAPLDENGLLQPKALEATLTDRTKLVALTAVSNATGVVNPVREVIGAAHARGVPVLIDAAQSVQHMPVDVRGLDCDFLVFSGHKMYAGTGVGVLYGKRRWLDSMPPCHRGGGMIERVTLAESTFAEPPLKFEAGTANLAGVMSLGAAIDFMDGIGLEAIREHEAGLIDHAVGTLESIGGVRLFGGSCDRCGSVSFNLENAHHHDVGLILDKLGIAVRTGAHCAEPLMTHLGVTGTVRASFALYNTLEEIDTLAAGVNRAREMLCG